MATTRLIFVGDIHLGRRPTGLGAALAELGLDARELSPAAAWASTVDEAARTSAAAVVLAGDVVEGERDRFEAYAHLERGVARLAAHGIPTYGVAGNHDGLVLPRLAERIDAFRLVGEGGAWECVPLGADADLLGWSFPDRHVRRSPLDDSLGAALAARRDDAALLGVLHADLDAVGSPYAPVARRDLERVPTDAWFLGHVHAPHPLTGPRPLGYLGSLVGLDAGEPGPRGPWRVDVDGPGRVAATQLPLVPIRWEAVTLDLSELEAPAADALDALQGRLHDVLRARRAADPTLADPRVRLVAVRLTLTGRPAHRAVARELALLPSSARILPVDGVPWVVEAVRDATRPRVDLARLAEQASPVGLLARRLLALEAEDPELETWIASLGEQGRRYRTGSWSQVDVPLPPTREVALEAGLRLLDVLLAQREAR